MPTYLRRSSEVLPEQRLHTQTNGLSNPNYFATSASDEIGADALTRARTLAAEIGAVVVGDASIATTIEFGLAALAEAFGSLNKRTDLDTPALLQAAAQIAYAVDIVGIEVWLVAVRAGPMDTYQHSLATAGVAAGFGIKAGLVSDDTIALTLAALLHDIGKARVPESILEKPGKLNKAEVEILRLHTIDGYEHLMAHSSLAPSIIDTVRHHHEMLNGSGYPDGLSGDAIADLTRVITICDIYAAVVEQRSYKPARPPQDALTVLANMAEAGKLDAELVREFTAIMTPA